LPHFTNLRHILSSAIKLGQQNEKEKFKEKEKFEKEECGTQR